MLRHLDAMLVVMNKTHSFIISGDGNVIEPDNDIVAIGSGGGFAMAAATALATFKIICKRYCCKCIKNCI